MATEGNPKLRQIFDAAVLLPPESRVEFLRLACAGDDMLHRQLIDLLAAHDSSAAFLRATPATQSVVVEASNLRTSVGPYRLLREVGQGGMGTVYQAMRSDDAFRKVVAIKIMRADMAHPDFERRFRQERQILATLDHPNIARIIDGGATEDGLPYYVMDFVEGLSINRHCDNLRLSLASRLRLLRQVCAAVQYLHDNQTIHRDLKPSNILVTADGTAKLLDFGIAKVEGLGVLQTMDVSGAGRLMTPKYASPEQRSGDPVGKASDIYSLGIILYEMVTGRHPFPEEAGFSNTSRPSPPRPSINLREDLQRMPETTGQLRRRVSGDLDNIVLKALQPQPAQRYASAAELAEDLQRYLDGRPVVARPISVVGRTVKLIRRNRLAAAVVVLLVLLVGIGAWQAVEARVQHARADAAQGLLDRVSARLANWSALTPAQQAEDVRQVRGLLSLKPLDDEGRPVDRSRMIQGVQTYLDRVAPMANSPAVAREVASSYQALADNQRDRAAAASTLEKGRALLNRFPDDVAAQHQREESGTETGPAQPSRPMANASTAPTHISPGAPRHPSTTRIVETQPAPSAEPDPPQPAPAAPDPELVKRYNHASAALQAEMMSVDQIRQSLARQGFGLKADMERSILSAKACLGEADAAIGRHDNRHARDQLQCVEAETRNLQQQLGR